MNYAIAEDAEQSNLYQTDEPVDGTLVFSTFSQAKIALIHRHVSMRAEYAHALRLVRSMRKEEVR